MALLQTHVESSLKGGIVVCVKLLFAFTVLLVVFPVPIIEDRVTSFVIVQNSLTANFVLKEAANEHLAVYINKCAFSFAFVFSPCPFITKKLLFIPRKIVVKPFTVSLEKELRSIDSLHVT